MTRDQLVEKRDQLLQDMEQIKANMHATSGAIQILDKLIAEEEAEKPDGE